VNHAGLLLGLLASVLLPCPRVHAQAPEPTLEEAAQAAHLIFIGTVESQGVSTGEARHLVFTSVRFTDVAEIHATEESVQRGADAVTLTYAGGETEGFSVSFSGAPRFADGRRYLLLVYDDGPVYANPVVGFDRGFYEVVRDRTTGAEYLLNGARKAVLSVEPGNVGLTRQRVDHIDNGAIVFDETPPPVEEWYFAQAPLASDPGGYASLSTEIGGEVPDPRPLPLEDFVEYILGRALLAPVPEPLLPTEGRRGRLYRRENGVIVSEELPPAPLDVQTYYDPELQACGYHDLFIVMEEVSTGHPTWADNNAAMVAWNDVMDVFRVTPDNGLYGADNGTSEFVGYLTSAETSAEYGFAWGGASGMTVNFYYGDLCDEISESDVMFNAACSWTYDLDYHLAHPATQLYRTTASHETGHVWGLMAGGKSVGAVETYAYDHPTVMNSESSVTVEDGRGIHVPDTYLMRRQYGDQAGINASWQDVGVESYYAQNGLRNSTTDAPAYHPGGAITVRNVTVENMSYTAVPDVRLRLYLSADSTITTSDHQVGSWWWSWGSFPGETYNVSNYTSTVPSAIPPGQYYVGAVVTVNGFAGDGNPANNATFLQAPVTIRPAAPSNVSATDGVFTDRVRVSWDAAAGATSYEVYRSTTQSGTKTYLGGTSATSYDDLSPVPAYPAWYWVLARSPWGDSLFSSSDAGYPGLDAPTNVQASDGAYTDKVRITWLGAFGSTSEVLWRSQSPVFATAQQIGTVTGGLEFDDTGAVPEILYYYWVEARSDAGASAVAGPDAGWRHLAAPTGVTASDGTLGGRVLLEWDPVPFAATFALWRHTSDAPLLAVQVASSTIGLSWEDTSAVPGQVYYYWVQALNAFGGSDFSAPDTGYASPLLFEDVFPVDSPSGDPDWNAVSGKWVVQKGAFTSSARLNNVATVKSLAGFSIGRIEALVQLTPRYRRGANGLIVFAWQGPSQYRYVRLTPKRVTIGQVGTFGNEAPGTKRSVPWKLPLKRWRAIHVDLLGDGSVLVNRGGAASPLVRYRFDGPAAGAVGCAARSSRTLFDRYRVWHASVLP